MKVAKIHKYEDVTFFELGYAVFGKPFITVMSYYIDGLLIDTGQHKMQSDFEIILKDYPVYQILLTHHHEDHSGNAEYLRTKLNVPLLTGRETKEWVTKNFPILMYQKQMFGKIPTVQKAEIFGKVIKTSKYTLYPVFTPGHSSDHYVFLEKEKGWLFSGDLYLGKLKYMRKGENMGLMIESLKNILTYDFDTIFCGHNPRLKNGKKYMQEKLEYLEEFYHKVMHLQQQGFSKKTIMKKMKLKEKTFLKLWTFTDVSVGNMVDAVISPKKVSPFN